MILVDTDAFAAELSRYIPLNPVRAGVFSGPKENPWLSYRSLAGLEEVPVWLETDFIHNFFDAVKAAAQQKYG